MWNGTQALVSETHNICSYTGKSSNVIVIILIYMFCYTDELGPDDLRSVRGEIFPVRNKWYDIGVELNIPYHSLNVIEKDCPNNCADCLRKMLEHWLTRTSPGPSWSGLVEALSSEPVGEKRLARQIRTKYCDTQDDNGDNVTTGMHLPITFPFSHYVKSRSELSIHIYTDSLCPVCRQGMCTFTPLTWV